MRRTSLLVATAGCIALIACTDQATPANDANAAPQIVNEAEIAPAAPQPAPAEADVTAKEQPAESSAGRREPPPAPRERPPARPKATEPESDPHAGHDMNNMSHD